MLFISCSTGMETSYCLELLSPLYIVLRKCHANLLKRSKLTASLFSRSTSRSYKAWTSQATSGLICAVDTRKRRTSPSRRELTFSEISTCVSGWCSWCEGAYRFRTWDRRTAEIIPSWCAFTFLILMSMKHDEAYAGTHQTRALLMLYDVTRQFGVYRYQSFNNQQPLTCHPFHSASSSSSLRLHPPSHHAKPQFSPPAQVSIPVRVNTQKCASRHPASVNLDQAIQRTRILGRRASWKKWKRLGVRYCVWEWRL